MFIPTSIRSHSYFIAFNRTLIFFFFFLRLTFLGCLKIWSTKKNRKLQNKYVCLVIFFLRFLFCPCIMFKFPNREMSCQSWQITCDLFIIIEWYTWIELTDIYLTYGTLNYNLLYKEWISFHIYLFHFFLQD